MTETENLSCFKERHPDKNKKDMIKQIQRIQGTPFEIEDASADANIKYLKMNYETYRPFRRKYCKNINGYELFN